jgi:hypothetical protein
VAEEFPGEFSERDVGKRAAAKTRGAERLPFSVAFRYPPFAIRPTLRLAAKTVEQFDKSPKDKTNPNKDKQAPVESERLVTRGRGKVRHEDEEVEKRTSEDGGELLEEAGEHGESYQLPVVSGQQKRIPRPPRGGFVMTSRPSR